VRAQRGKERGHSAAEPQPQRTGVGVSACGRIGERGDCRRSDPHPFWWEVEEWKGGWKSAFFQSSILPSFHLIQLEQSGPLRLQTPRSGFADTPHADTPTPVLCGCGSAALCALRSIFAPKSEPWVGGKNFVQNWPTRFVHRLKSLKIDGHNFGRTFLE
jgi:hypothetical protein